MYICSVEAHDVQVCATTQLTWYYQEGAFLGTCGCFRRLPTYCSGFNLKALVSSRNPHELTLCHAL